MTINYLKNNFKKNERCSKIKHIFAEEIITYECSRQKSKEKRS